MKPVRTVALVVCRLQVGGIDRQLHDLAIRLVGCQSFIASSRTFMPVGKESA